MSAAVSSAAAREELSKFFIIADWAEQPPAMFSGYIDAEWHRFMETEDYQDFCLATVGRFVSHAPINGEGAVSWLDLYHERFGLLPAVWFADADGAVDTDVYSSYLETLTVNASWNCAADPDIFS